MTRLFGDTAIAALAFALAISILTIPGPLDPVETTTQE